MTIKKAVISIQHILKTKKKKFITKMLTKILRNGNRTLQYKLKRTDTA